MPELRQKRTLLQKLEREVMRPVVQAQKALERTGKRITDRRYRATGAAILHAEQVESSANAPSRVAAVFVYYGPPDIDAETWRTVEILNQAGLGVFFVSNSHLSEGALVRLRGLVADITIRRNVGYDFGGYRDALLERVLPRTQSCVDGRFERCLLINNTIQFHPTESASFINRSIDDGRDLVGIVDCTDQGDFTRYHFGSFWLSVSQRLLYAPEFAAFWTGYQPRSDKTYTVENGEFGLCKFAHYAGFSTGGLIERRSLIERARALLEGEGENAIRERLIIPDGNITKIAARKQRLMNGAFADEPDLIALLRYEMTFHAGTIMLSEFFDVPLSKRAYLRTPEYGAMYRRKGWPGLGS